MKLMEPGDAIDLVYSIVGRRVAEKILMESSHVTIEDLHGRLLAEPVRASIPLPPTLRSTRDGYAVSSRDLIGASEAEPVKLRVSGYSRIGDSRVLELREGECIRVDTGSIVPRGADAVIPVEDTIVDGDYVLSKYTPRPGSNLALPASDVASGDIIAPRGTRGYPEVVAALASQGYRFVKASRRVKVAIFSGGDELLEPGSPYRLGGVFDTNRFYLSSLLKLLGYEVTDLGIISDDPAILEETILKAAEISDLVITTGGISVGAKDYVIKILESRGRLLARGLRVKPGKSTTVGLLDETIVIGIPGNPRPVVNITRNFLIPLLDRLGLPAYTREPMDREVTLATRVTLDKERRLSLPLTLIEFNKGFLGFPVAVGGYMIASLPRADSEAGLEKGDFIEAGATIRARSYRYPERDAVIALTDTKLLDLGSLNSRVIISIVKNAGNILDMLKGARVRILLSSLQVVDLESIRDFIEWGSKRRILKIGSRTCGKTAVFKPYSNMKPGDFIVDRAETAVILLDQGYVDCAVIPEDYAADNHDDAEELGLEDVILAKLG